MFLSVDTVNLFLFCVQQLGVTLAVGGETVVLVAYLLSIRDGVIDAKETQFARAVQNVLFFGVVCMVLSGIAITFLHIAAGEQATIMAPAYLFKWALIVLALFLGASWYAAPQSVVNGLAGGTWYAVFLVHTLAPSTTWLNLLTLYGIWLVGFNLCWAVLVFSLRGKVGATSSTTKEVKKPTSAGAAAPAAAWPLFKPKPAAPPAPAAPVAQTPKPIIETPKPAMPSPSPSAPVPPPAVQPPPMAQPVAPAPAVQPATPQPTAELPSLQVMPKNPQDIK